MTMIHGRRIAPRRSYWSAKTLHELAFQARYLEAILDILMGTGLGKPLWCRYAEKYLKRSCAERAMHVWRGAPPPTAFLAGIADPLRDEAIWSIGRTLDELHSTVEFGVEVAGPMLV